MWRTAGVFGENTAILTASIDVLLLGRGLPGLPQVRGVQDGFLNLVQAYVMWLGSEVDAP